MIPRQVPPLNAVRAFDAIVRHGSASAAARALFVSQSAVSRHVARLEDFVGCRLLERGARGSVPTPAGAELAAASGPALDALATVSARLRSRAAGVRTVRMVSLSSFALRWLAPRLADFQRVSGGVVLDLRIADGPPDFARGDADCAFVSEPGAGVETELFEESLAMVRAPDGDGPAPKGAGRPALHTSSRPELWTLWRAAVPGAPGHDAARAFAFQDFYITIAAAVAGAGLAVVPAFLIEDELRAGTLVEPVAARVPTGRRYRLALAPGRARDPDVLLVRDWLLRRLETG